MTYNLHRTKLPKSFRFPIKRSALDAALEGAQVGNLTGVTFATRQRGAVVLRAEFTGEHRKGWAGAGKVALFIYAVPTTQQRTIEQALLRGPLAQVCKWLRSAELAGNAWREADHHLEVTQRGEDIEVREW